MLLINDYSPSKTVQQQFPSGVLSFIFT